MMHCIEGEKEGAWKLAIDREVVHADCVWVGLRPTIDAEIVANERMWESAFAGICYFGGRDFTEIDLVGFCRHLLL